jgi:hypothetical protein
MLTYLLFKLPFPKSFSCKNSMPILLCLVYYFKKSVPQPTYGGAGGEEVSLLLIHDLGTRWG